jgi:hypothetical protein
VKINKKCFASENRNVTRTLIDSHGVIHDYYPIEGIGDITQGDGGVFKDRFTLQSADEKSVDEVPDIGLLSRSFQLPISMPLGQARYRSVACFACNPTQYIWPVCISQPELIFTVYSPDAGGGME